MKTRNSLTTDQMVVDSIIRPGLAARCQPAYVLHSMFGAHCLVVADHYQDAWELAMEWAVEHGMLSEVLPDDPALFDYDGTTVAEQVESATNAGDIEWVAGRGAYWRDHYMTVQEYRTIAEAGRAFRGEASR